jgi:dolichol-phosphate mannosyltransferase
MTAKSDYLLSVVVPLYNEAGGLKSFHASLTAALADSGGDYEIIYCDDGSADDTADAALRLHASDPKVKLLKLSRHFGKEPALSAGIAAARGQAVIMIDGDGQHPPELIPQFVNKWRQGAQVVVGLRRGNQREGLVKRYGSKLFYRLFNRLAQQKLLPGSTDFRLIDGAVRSAFLELRESDRITRGLIDWLGFRREYISFDSKAREQDRAGYGHAQLVRLAMNSVVSLTTIPLYLFGYLGMFITTGAALIGSAIIVEQLLLGDPLNWNFTGTAMLSIMLLFLVGLVLLSQGMLSLYVSHIHSQSKRRPLYVVDYDASIGVKHDT